MSIIKNYFNIFLSFLFAIIYLIPLNHRSLWQPDEVRYAEISREMIERGDWVVPYLLDLRYFEKPIAGYWLNAISQLMLGENNFAVRFASVFSTAVCAYFVYKIAIKTINSVFYAKIATLIFITMFIIISVGTYSVLDPMLMMWLTGAFYYIVKIIVSIPNSDKQAHIATNTDNHKISSFQLSTFVLDYVLLGLFCGFAFLTKGFLGIVIPAIVLLPTLLILKRFIEIVKNLWLSLIAFLIICGPWAIAIHLREPDYWHYFFWIEHVQRFAHENAQHKAPFWYYVPIVILGSLPWLGFVIPSLRHAFTQRKNALFLLLLLWFFLPLIFFSLAKGKLLTYILPCMPSLAILISAYIKHSKEAIERYPVIGGKFLKSFKINSLINVCIGLLGITALLIMANNIHPKIAIFDPNEYPKIFVGIIIFLSWSCFGLVSYFEKQSKWYFAAGCPLLLSLLIGYTIPNQIIDSKQPQNFIQLHVAKLFNSETIISDSIGIATALGYELKRGDIFLLDEKGELEYGFNYTDSGNRFVAQAQFDDWLNEKRKIGNVSLVLLLKRDQQLSDFPSADYITRQNRLVLIWFSKQ